MASLSIDDSEPSGLPVQRVGDLDVADPENAWLIRNLWLEQAVGIIGGAPKCCKSWLGLDMAVSIASATPCLGRFDVAKPGAVLAYMAEDALPSIRKRIEGLCAHRKLNINRLNFHIITAPALRLDMQDDRDKLEQTIHQLKPRMLLLDPLVRLHRLDENSSGDISGLLSFLRCLSRSAALAIALVHHMSKNRRAQLGQSLRGSGDLHAWGDSNAYLVRKKELIHLTLEHRAAPAPEPFALALVSHEENTAHLEMSNPSKQVVPTSLCERIKKVLTDTSEALSRTALRQMLHVNNKHLGDALLELERNGSIQRTREGWSMVAA